MAQLPPVNCKHGAPMGRPDQPNSYSEFKAIPDHPHKFTLQKVRLDRGGYDSGGAYWGLRKHGESLYWAENEFGTITRFLDAKDRDEAKATIRREFPRCRFYR